MTYTPTTADVEESFILQRCDVDGYYRTADEAASAFREWRAEEIRKAKQRGARTERERIASLAEQIRNNHDVAECAAYVEGETGRAEAISRWETLCDEPDAWLRGLADDPQWLEAQLSGAWEDGALDAALSLGHTAHTAANPYTEAS